uniref:Uncharacterized protein n=1 Tax=Macrostomum lignano TaxID=282301 RepID=A0A1I8HGE3_9PLAT
MRVQPKVLVRTQIPVLLLPLFRKRNLHLSPLHHLPQPLRQPAATNAAIWPPLLSPQPWLPQRQKLRCSARIGESPKLQTGASIIGIQRLEIRVLGNSGPTAAAPAAAPAAAAASVTPATAPVVGPWTPVTSSTSTSCSTVSSQQKAVSSAQHSPGPIKRPAIIEKVLPAGSLKRSTDTDDTCTFKSKRPK